MLLDNSGDECEVELTAFGRGGITCRVLARRAAPAEAGPRVTIYQCLLKGEKFGWVLQKATELGVAEIVPVVSERTVAAEGKRERWERIVREAAEQSCRARLPVLHDPIPWRAAVAHAAAAGSPALVPWEEADPNTPLGPALSRARSAPGAGLFIGSEGGLTADEIALAGAAGIVAVSLGPRAFRAETAAVAALALLLIPT